MNKILLGKFFNVKLLKVRLIFLDLNNKFDF